MTLIKGRPLAARWVRPELAPALGNIEDEHGCLQSAGDSETFRLSVQFAQAHGVQSTVRRGEITTLSSSALLSGASSR
ncbi:hypothetical protein JM946_28400 [Steroidobacter sp. S1-65]|uniref:Uncharacterized protein n=1 Tax=Steroidobacter gossypii TaxID=2805490 RepID=A0ABS1X615_9GAMM|nr:hypothetical protein [Steroidobacter gossypii]MBM0108671.1 hypothetical protein [Steroidobacter gossypii]